MKQKFEGYRFEDYDYNGWVYNLKPGKYNIIVATGPTDDTTACTDTNFLLRVRGPAMNGKSLYKLEETEILPPKSPSR